MKKFIYMMIASLGLVSCESDYLETAPNDAIATSAAFSTTHNVALAVNGLARMMTTQYLSTQGMNGEGTIKNWYNNFNGNDCQKANQTGWSSLWNNLDTYKTSTTSSYGYYPWFYYYKLIGNANAIIGRVDDAEGEESDRQFLKAQALVYRAYSYMQLIQLYSTRWCDSNDGASKGVVLRVEETDPMKDLSAPLSTMAEVYAQIYSDLDNAITLFTQSGVKSKDVPFYLPTLEAAYAVYARAALNREDWSNAAKYAALARNGHALMKVSDYKSGFNTKNSEWIWGVYEAEDQTLHYYSYFAYIGSNSSAGACRNYPACISKQLVDQIPATDVRRELFLIPQTDTEFKEMASNGKTTKGTMYTRGKTSGYVYSTSLIFGYMQFKMRATFMPGGGCFHLFRSAEMYYAEAEAQCHLGNYTEAQDLLYAANKQYDDSLTVSTKTGDELLEEVKLYRRFDLWGEGHDWSDFKRWKQDIKREKLTTSKGLQSPGSWHSTFAVTIPANDDTRWIWAIPNKETDYNDAID